ncbi:MAG: hypothetical protein COA49_00415 [Bacteroidetes bacterium]|nr:MAG: hypothetical protein COA49_00415 [Bacteroidota bacterium]
MAEKATIFSEVQNFFFAIIYLGWVSQNYKKNANISADRSRPIVLNDFNVLLLLQPKANGLDNIISDISKPLSKNQINLFREIKFCMYTI